MGPAAPAPPGLRALIRADASRSIGHGHVMRCLALATALRAQGVQAVFAQAAQPGDARAAIEAAGFACLALPPGLDEAADAAACAALLRGLGGAGLVVLDHYRRGALWVRTVRAAMAAAPPPRTAAATGRVLVIDDLADRALDADLLLDPNWHDDPAARYRPWWPGADAAGAASAASAAVPRALFGPGFALLRDEFPGTTVPQRDGRIRRVLLAFGGGDPGDATGACLSLLQPALPGLAWDVVLGPAAPQADALRARWAGVPGVTVVQGASDMARRMAAADLFVGAGGSMTWERACLGLPGVTLALADNQRPLSARLAAVDEGIDLGGFGPAALAALVPAVQALCADPARVQAMGRALRRRCDGLGASRVARAVMAALAAPDAAPGA